MTAKVINFYGGPGTGKSTAAAALFAELKYRGVNCEYIPEYAKDATWEKRGAKVFAAQEYIFAKQHFRLSRVADEVDYIITDAPLLLGLIYTPDNFMMPSLKQTIAEAAACYDSLDIFLIRTKAYQPKGRHQTEDEAKVLDQQIFDMLKANHVPAHVVVSDRLAPIAVIELMKDQGWQIPDA